MIAQKGSENLGYAGSYRRQLAAKNFNQFFQFEPHLMNELLALIEIHLRIVAGEAVPRTADRKPLFIQQAANLTNDEHILPLIVPAVPAPFHRFQLGKFLFPIAQYVGLHPAQFAHFTDGEIPLAGDRRQFAIVAWFQHTPRRGPSISAPDGM